MAAFLVAWTIAALSGDFAGTVRNESRRGLAGARVVVVGMTPGQRRFETLPEAWRTAKSDAEGRFTLPGLDPARKYELLVAAPGHAAALFKIDPARTEEPLTLKPDGIPPPPGEAARGRVVDPDGKPVANAVVETFAIARGDSTTYGHTGPTPWAMTDGKGEFALRLDAPTERPLVKIVAPGFTWKKARTRGAGETTIALDRGAGLFGVLKKSGVPVAGALMGAGQTSRNSETYLGERFARTDAQGRFEFAALPAGEEHHLFGIAETLQDHGIVATRMVALGAVGTTVDAGATAVVPGVAVAGRLRLAQGDWPEKGLALGLAADDSFDSIEILVGSDGKFRFEHAPPGPCRLFLRGESHRFAAANRSVDLIGYALIGVVDVSSDGLRIDLEAGKPDWSKMNDWKARQKREGELRRLPLRGVEGD